MRMYKVKENMKCTNDVIFFFSIFFSLPRDESMQHENSNIISSHLQAIEEQIPAASSTSMLGPGHGESFATIVLPGQANQD